MEVLQYIKNNVSFQTLLHAVCFKVNLHDCRYIFSSMQRMYVSQCTSRMYACNAVLVYAHVSLCLCHRNSSERLLQVALLQTCIHARIHEYRHNSISILTHTHVHISVHACMLYMYVHKYILTYVRAHMHAYMHTHMYVLHRTNRPLLLIHHVCAIICTS